MYEYNLSKIMFKIAFSILMGTLIFTILKISLTDYKGINDISSGYVTDKKIVYENATWFRDGVMEYILYVEGEYTNAFDKQVKFVKKFYVSEEAYTHYNIGNYFDSKNLIETKEERKEN